MAGPGLEDPALPSGPLDLAFPIVLCHPGHEYYNRDNIDMQVVVFD